MLPLLLLVACNGSTEPDADAPRARRLTVAGYTTPREAYEAAIFPAFAADWKARTGETVTFEATWQGSGAQARAVREGLEADVVALSLETDVVVLEDAGLITSDWRAGPHGGIVTHSLAVLAVRPDNPKGVRDWADLARPGVEVLTPNVRTSGGAMWNVMGLVGAARRGKVEGVGATDEDAATLLRGVLANVRVMDKGARESIVTFEKGVGDVAITYENEVLAARRAGKDMDYVVPPSTVRIDNPLVVVDTYAAQHGTADLAEAFVAFCHGPEAQAAYAEHGFRPVEGTAGDLPAPEDLFTVADLGGWDAVKSSIFAPGALYDKATRR